MFRYLLASVSASLLVSACAPAQSSSTSATSATSATGTSSDPGTARAPETSSAAANPPPASGTPAEASTTWRDVKTTDHEAVVAPDSVSVPYAEASEGRWSPDDATIATAEAALPAALAKEPRAKRLVKEASKYKRQYFGFLVGSKKRLYINAFCMHEDRMREQAIMVKDGGDCYFQAVYDLQTQKIVYLAINGEA